MSSADPAGAEIEHRVEAGRLVAAQPHQRRIGQHRQRAPPARRVVMHHQHPVGGTPNVELHRVRAQGYRRLERRGCVPRGVA